MKDLNTLVLNQDSHTVKINERDISSFLCLFPAKYAPLKLLYAIVNDQCGEGK